MTTEDKNLADVILGALQLLAIVAGGLWAFWRLRRERLHVPRVAFDLSCNFFGPQQGFHIAEVVATMTNHGVVKHVVSDIFLRIRGLLADEVPQRWEGHGERLVFPLRMVDDDIIYKQKYSYVFVEPGVSQPLTYITRIPVQVRYILVRVEFRYAQTRNHSVERVFAVPSSGGA